MGNITFRLRQGWDRKSGHRFHSFYSILLLFIILIPDSKLCPQISTDPISSKSNKVCVIGLG